MASSDNAVPDPARAGRPRRPARHLLRRLAVAATAGGLLLVSAPVAVEVAAPSDAAGPRLRLLAARAHHHAHHHAHHRAHPRRGHAWAGHPGRWMLPHRVKPGDTATELAVRFHAWTAELVAVNHLSSGTTLYAGERVRIPVVLSAWRQARHGHHKAHHHAKRHHPRHHAKAHHHKAHHRPKRHHPKAHHHKAHHHEAHHHPWRHAGASRAKVRRAVLRQAHRRHVSPTLALAIAWQESGWQQRRLSSAHAIGTMQVLPATGRWLESFVDRPLNLYGLHDNARAGVVLIDILRGQTGLRRTVAGYYQGLASVRAFGMYDSTRAYVRNVLAIRKRLAHGWNPA